jgi:hypothetical protein
MTDESVLLADFEAAKLAFIAAIEGIPAQALGYLRAGDEYSLGGVVTHINAVLERYGAILDRIVLSDQKSFDAHAIDERFEAENRTAIAGVTGAGRVEGLARMEKLHGRICTVMGSTDRARWDHKTLVGYGSGEHPTSPADLTSWLTAHYREHVPHLEQILGSWREDR